MLNNQHIIKKGLDIVIPGTAEKILTELPLCGRYAVKPSDYVGVIPRLLVSEGDSVMAGTPLFEDKNNEGVPFVSPVKGTVSAIVRGEKRALQSVVVTASDQQQSVSYDTVPIAATDSEKVRNTMMASGLWNCLRQRPFGIVPRKDSRPKALFITAFDSSPLPIDMDFVLNGREADFQYGIDILNKIVSPIYLCLNGTSQRDSFLAHTANAEIHYFNGPHPSGLAGTHIACISPINKGETVWTVSAQDVVTIGHLFRTGEYRPERTVALCGPAVDRPQYYRVTDGVGTASIVGGHLVPERSKTGHLRIVCGNVLSGTTVTEEGYLSAACDKISVIAEGDYYDFMGWLRPNFRKFSFSHTFLSGFIKRRTEWCAVGSADNGERRTLSFTFDTGRHGSVRPLFVTGEFEKLVPLDIYPMQLIKACIIGDIEMMENLGIYEVEPEDLALCEFADTSKTEIQSIIRAGLEKIRKEAI